MKVLVVHDVLGRIVSVTQITPSLAQGVGIMPIAGHSVLELDIKGELAKKSLIDIHNHCCIDINTRKLVTRSR